jgi:radical SAM protein with 4Fe4S-binding SPASM domain
MHDFPALEDITVEITQTCHQKCVHCSSGASEDSPLSLRKDEIITLIGDFIGLGGKRIAISGGEPFLHQDILNLVSYLDGTSLEVDLYTCGMIDQNDALDTKLDEIVEFLRTKRINQIVFSLQGATAETHDSITGKKGSFSQAIKFIGKLVSARCHVAVHYVPMTPNFEEFEDLIDYAAKLGVEEISVLRFVPQGRGQTNREWLMLKKEESARLIELLAASKKRNDISVRIGSHLDFTFLLDDSNPKACTAGKSKCLVEPNGDVIPCAVFKGMNSFIAGNIREKSLTEIWGDSRVFGQFRTFDPKSLKGLCSVCEQLSKCQGRCPAQRMYDTGDFYQGPDSYCPKEFFH